MKKFVFYTLLLAFVASFSFTGCKYDDECDCLSSEPLAYETLTTYLKSVDMNLDKIMTNADGQKFVMFPADGDLSSKYIIDIRSAEAFGSGHIDGAHNVAFTNILTEAAKADKPIVVVCFTGQTACYATSLLRLYGYENAQALKWGMSGWNPGFDSWTSNCKELTNSTNWTTSATSAGNFEAPSWTSNSTNGADILKERVEAVVAAGFKTVKNTDVLANPADYYINNYFSDAHYTGFGHVNGAVRISPLLIDNCSSLDPSKKVVTYCYTGQTSAVITAYLNVLGFDAYSLTFGVNGMAHSNSFWSTGGTDGGAVPNHWGVNAGSKDFPVVTN
uniref:rhodanese-like domain-containing protein n=1 Tax=uncultured Draconibacterium sp. TaxID=1573823 RepID=UPI003217E170